MDYEKKIREYMVSSKVDQLYKSMLINLFPELKESEDERIRKEIIDFATKANNGVTSILANNYDFNKWIAYLEKQGEQKTKNECVPVPCIKIIDKATCGEQKPADKIQIGKEYKCIASPRYSTFMVGKIYKPEDKYLCSLMNFCSDCFEPIEDGEPKPDDKVEPKFKIGDKVIPKNHQEESLTITKVTDTEYYSGDLLICKIDEQDKWELVEQKPVEWSYVDSNTLFAVINDLRSCGKCSTDRYIWLKSLKDRCLPQPKPEWSEEDEKIKEDFLSFLKDNETKFIKESGCIPSWSKYITWLKSLRPQSQWKPSKEQIKAFEYCIENNCCNKDGINGSKMVELYKQLKAL